MLSNGTKQWSADSTKLHYTSNCYLITTDNILNIRENNDPMFSVTTYSTCISCPTVLNLTLDYNTLTVITMETGSSSYPPIPNSNTTIHGKQLNITCKL